MKVMLILAFMASTIVLVILWPEPMPPFPEPIHPGPGVTHVDAVTLNAERLEQHQRLARQRLIRIGGAGLAITVIVTMGVRIGRRLG